MNGKGVVKLTPEWYRLRSAIFESRVSRNAVLDELATCDHPDAVRLRSVIVRGMDDETMLSIMESHHDDIIHIHGVYGSTFLGDGLIYTINIDRTPVDHSLGMLLRAMDGYMSWIDAANMGGEPKACARAAISCVNFTDRIEKLEPGAYVGDCQCTYMYARCFHVCDPIAYYWFERAYIVANSDYRKTLVVKALEESMCNSKSHFYIGQMLANKIVPVSSKLVLCVFIYRNTVAIARTATLTAILCLQRLRMSKDVARLIGSLVFFDLESFLE